MSPSTSVSGSDESPNEPSLRRARALLLEALEIVDALRLSPEIGARLQHVIDSLDEEGGAEEKP